MLDYRFGNRGERHNYGDVGRREIRFTGNYAETRGAEEHHLVEEQRKAAEDTAKGTKRDLANRDPAIGKMNKSQQTYRGAFRANKLVQAFKDGLTKFVSTVTRVVTR